MKRGIVFNTESAYWYEKDLAFRRIVDSSDFLTCDGAPLARAARARGVSLTRYHGPDLMRDILNEPRFKRIYLLGGPVEAHERIRSTYAMKGRSMAGDTGFYPGDLPAEAMQKIKEARPDVIFVCLGLRKQERVAAQISRELAEIDGIVVGVGASIDFLGGTRIRSGKFFQRLGLEWLPRMIREPRMFRRNFRALRSIPMILSGRVAIIYSQNFVPDLKAMMALVRK